MNQQNTQPQQIAQIIIKGQELTQLNALLEEFPHYISKKIIAFVNSTQQNRQAELVAEQVKAHQVANLKELEELRAYKSLNEACKTMKKETKTSKPRLTKGLLHSPGMANPYDGAKVNPSKLDDLLDEGYHSTR